MICSRPGHPTEDGTRGADPKSASKIHSTPHTCTHALSMHSHTRAPLANQHLSDPAASPQACSTYNKGAAPLWSGSAAESRGPHAAHGSLQHPPGEVGGTWQGAVRVNSLPLSACASPGQPHQLHKPSGTCHPHRAAATQPGQFPTNSYRVRRTIRWPLVTSPTMLTQGSSTTHHQQHLAPARLLPHPATSEKADGTIPREGAGPLTLKESWVTQCFS